MKFSGPLLDVGAGAGMEAGADGVGALADAGAAVGASVVTAGDGVGADSSVGLGTGVRTGAAPVVARKLNSSRTI